MSSHWLIRLFLVSVLVTGVAGAQTPAKPATGATPAVSAPASPSPNPDISKPTTEKPADATKPGGNVPMEAPDAAAKSTPGANATPTATPAPAATPTTTIYGDSGAPTNGKPSGPDPFLDVAPVPKGTVSLIGGIVRSLDRIRNRLT